MRFASLALCSLVGLSGVLSHPASLERRQTVVQTLQTDFTNVGVAVTADVNSIMLALKNTGIDIGDDVALLAVIQASLLNIAEQFNASATFIIDNTVALLLGILLPEVGTITGVITIVKNLVIAIQHAATLAVNNLVGAAKTAVLVEFGIVVVAVESLITPLEALVTSAGLVVTIAGSSALAAAEVAEVALVAAVASLVGVVGIPGLPTPTLPAIAFPTLPALPALNIPTLPVGAIPTVPAVKVPTVPAFGVPTLPAVKAPTVPAPALPTLPFKLPFV